VASHPEFSRTLGDANPKDLRAAFVSLLARAGRSDADIAEETGHSVEVLRKHYLGAIKMLRNLDSLPAEEQIRLAREKAGTTTVAQALRRELAEASGRPKLGLTEPELAL
jgi:predicted transcriptional regulator